MLEVSSYIVYGHLKCSLGHGKKFTGILKGYHYTILDYWEQEKSLFHSLILDLSLMKVTIVQLDQSLLRGNRGAHI